MTLRINSIQNLKNSSKNQSLFPSLKSFLNPWPSLNLNPLLSLLLSQSPADLLSRRSSNT